MVLESKQHGTTREVMAIVAGLSIQDPRERPLERRAQADQQHARFTDPSGDFLSLLNLWNYLEEKQKDLGSSAFRRLCKAEYLNYLRIREWQDVHSQLRQTCKELGIGVPSASAEPASVHRALVSGLLSHVGSHDQTRRDYLGARGARWAIHPGSALSRKPPAFAMAAELVETSRLFGRVVARIDPLDVERVAGELVVRTYSEPRW